MLSNQELARPVAEGGIHVVRIRLQEFVRQAQVLLTQPEDDEALHDARVAVRRVRVWLGVLQGAIDISRKDARALRAFARASSPLRDLEVQQQWLDGLVLETSEQAGRSALQSLLHERYGRARDQLFNDLPEALAAAEHMLKGVGAQPGHDEPLGAWLAERWMEWVVFYGEDLPRLPENLHALRLLGKQLRYLLEPMLDALDAQDVMLPLRRGQDALGRVNDAQVMRAAMPGYMGELLHRQFEADVRMALEMDVAPEWREPAIWPGLRAICARLISEESEALADVYGWRHAHADALRAGLHRIGVQLAASEFDALGHPLG